MTKKQDDIMAHGFIDSQKEISRYIAEEIYKKIEEERKYDGLLTISVNNVFDWSEFNDDSNGTVDEVSLAMRERYIRGYIQYLINSKVIKWFSEISRPEVNNSPYEYDDRYNLSGRASLDITVDCEKFRKYYVNNIDQGILIDGRPSIDVKDLMKYVRDGAKITNEVKKLMDLFLRNPGKCINYSEILDTMNDRVLAEEHKDPKRAAGKKVSKLNKVLKPEFKVVRAEWGGVWIFRG